MKGATRSTNDSPYLVCQSVQLTRSNTMSLFRQLWICVAALLTHRVASDNILAYFPFPAMSHHKVYRPIIEELAERGHQITYVTPFPMENPPLNLTVISTESILQGGLKNSGVFLRKSPSFFRQMNTEKFIRHVIFEETMKVDKVHQLINSGNKFDLILHGLFLQEHAAAFQYKFNALGVVIFPFGDYSWANELAGSPDNAAFMVNFHRQATDDMSFIQRVVNTAMLYASTLWSYYDLYCMQGDIDLYFNFTDSDRPGIIDLASDQALFLSHIHHAVTYPFPRAPHFKLIGGVAIPKPHPLPQDLQKFMDDAPDGVIFFSFGSTLTVSKLFTSEERDTFASVFARLKQRVIWKWEAGEWPGIPKNVKVSNWYPQTDILAHVNCKLFITHGGLLSLIETVYFKVPVVVIPVFGDQPKNAKFITTAPIGVRLDLNNITRDSVTWAVEEAMNNNDYKKEARRRSELLKDSPDPKEQAIRWIEYVLKHGRALQPKGARLPFYKLHLFDVMAFFIFVLTACFCLILNTLQRATSKFCETIRINLVTKRIKIKSQ